MEKKITVRLNDKNEMDAKVLEILSSVSNASEYIKSAVLAVSETSAVEVYLTGWIRKVVAEGNLQTQNLSYEKHEQPKKEKQPGRVSKSVQSMTVHDENESDDLDLNTAAGLDTDAMELLEYML